MPQYTTKIQQFKDKGEKTGWTYIVIPESIAQELKPGNKKSFRVKGKLDQYAFEGIALLPMGEGDFIMALNAAIRKGIKKIKGASLKVQIEIDTEEKKINAELLECLADEPKALKQFKSLTPGHQRYFSNWIEDAKTDTTKSKRITQAVTAMLMKLDYGQMIRMNKKNRAET